MDTIQIRIDQKSKKAAKKVFADLGMDLSTGLKVYLTRVIKEKAIPFKLRTVNGFTLEQEAEIIRETEYAKKYGKRYHSVEEMMADL